MRMVDANHLLAQQVAAHLLSIKAVILSPDKPFTWASGLKSPIYCDNRLTMAYPEVRTLLTTGFLGLLKQHNYIPDVIVGTATAGIPHAAWLSSVVGLPMAYVRSKPKAHGRGNQIEGLLKSGQHAVIVEDLVSTGKSSVAVVDAVKDQGLRVDAVLAIFSYGLPKAIGAFSNAGVPLHTLTTFETLLQVALEYGMLNAAEIDSLKAWHADPKAWSDKKG